MSSPVKRAIKIVPPTEQVSGGYTPTIIARNQIKINSKKQDNKAVSPTKLKISALEKTAKFGLHLEDEASESLLSGEKQPKISNKPLLKV